jgi:hypothetical protein
MDALGWVFAVVFIFGLVVAFFTSLRGLARGPIIFGLGLAGVGALLLRPGPQSPATELGLMYLGGSLGEFAAAIGFWWFFDADRKPSRRWRIWAVGIAVAGLALLPIAFFALLVAYCYACAIG